MKPIPEEALRALPEGHYAFWGGGEERLWNDSAAEATLLWSVGKYRPCKYGIGYCGNDPANLYARPLSMKPGRVAELELELAAAVKERDELKGIVRIHRDEAEGVKQRFERAIEVAVELRKERDEARAELDAIKARMGETPKLESLHMEGGVVELVASHPVLAFIANELYLLLKEAGGTNYVEFTVNHKEQGEFTLLLQRKEGKTPAQLNLELKAELAELRGKEACANCGTKCMWPPRYGQCRQWTPKQEPAKPEPVKSCWTCAKARDDQEYNPACTECIDLEGKTLRNWTPKAEPAVCECGYQIVDGHCSRCYRPDQIEKQEKGGG